MHPQISASGKRPWLRRAEIPGRPPSSLSRGQWFGLSGSRTLHHRAV